LEINDEISLIKNTILNVVKDCEKIYLFGSFAYFRLKKTGLERKI